MKHSMKIIKIIGFVLLGIFGLAAFGFITMYLWNWLIPELFNGPYLTFWQTIGLLVLSKILFSGFGKGGGHHGKPWRPYWKDRWDKMSPEDRERIKQKMKAKWCYREPETPGANASISTD